MLTALCWVIAAVSSAVWAGQAPLLRDTKHIGDDNLLHLHRRLIEAESTSQGLEKSAAIVLQSYFHDIGWSSMLLPTFGDHDRPNVFAWPGSTNHTDLLISSHIDTVPPYIPYSRKDDKVWGRGSADAKASIATQLFAVQRAVAKGSINPESVAVLYVSGEETAGDGMRSFSEDMVAEGRSWDQVLFGEPTEGKVAIGHKGMVMFKIMASGKAAHSGYPELGSSANDKLVDLLYELKSHDWPQDRILGNSTFNIGQMDGGAAANVVSAMATAHCAIRVAADLQNILSYLRTTIALHADISFDVEQAAEPTKLDSIDGLDFEETIVK